MESNNPVQTRDRIVFLDALRGFAILGIFIANLNIFSGYHENINVSGPFLRPTLDSIMSFIHLMFIEGKFYTIFSLLFGWGIALQIESGNSKNINPIPTIKRRLRFMLLLGGMHLLIWSGDIVFFYALLAFILLQLRRCSNKSLLILAAVLIFLPIILYAIKSHWLILNYPSWFLFHLGDKVLQNLIGKNNFTNINIFKEHLSWLDYVKINIGGFFYRYGDLFFVSRIPKVFGVFLIGFVIGRTNFYKNFNQHKKTIYWIIGIGLFIGLPSNFILSYFITYYNDDYNNLKLNGLYQTIVNAIGVVPLALAYVFMLMLFFERNLGKRILSSVAPIGKMAFSNYILNSLIGNYIFVSAGLGYSRMVGPFYYTILGLLIYGMQIIISTLWMKYFNFGPIEWLWRSLTYKKWLTILKARNNYN